MSSLKNGNVIDGRYKIVKPLGQGGEGSVYLAINERSYKFWAIKVIEKQNSSRTGMELELWKHLSHPKLPDVVDVIEEDNYIFLVMDYIPGRTAASVILEEKAISWRKAVGWCIEICEVLTYLHEQNPPIIYGDLKPQNLICKEDSGIVLVDFGTLCPQIQRKDDKVTGNTRGTRGYAPPEQYGKDADIRTDIYCLGITLFEMLTGHLPRGSLIEEMNQSRIPRKLQKVIYKCTRQNKNERYDSCRQCRQALERGRKQGDIKYILIVCAAATTIAAGVFLNADKKVREIKIEEAQIYEAYLKEANLNVYEEKKELCKKAIFYHPDREEAYQLLVETFLADGVLTEKEDVYLRKILKERTDNNGITNEEKLKTNTRGYLEISNELGMAYWYHFQGEGGKSYAARWFLNVEEACLKLGVDSAERKRAKILARIGGYYEQLNRMGSSAHNNVSYRNYWEDMVELYHTADEEIENISLSLLLWEEITSQIGNRTERFLSEGVGLKDMSTLMEEIEKRLKRTEGGIKSKEDIETKGRIAENLDRGKSSIKRNLNIREDN